MKISLDDFWSRYGHSEYDEGVIIRALMNGDL